ncbi:hypothetical protein PR048_001454 [Dryococelus australis]|uniref:Uncharacterized protein n=1 Tax=Dryococelus australis TaxID=614101 RepID=A0ABQ9IHH7_9NEOP|nr:hypothetical protein PR048_001454 [Dryococelus australis]
MSAYTRQNARSKYRNRIRLGRASQNQSSDAHRSPHERVKRCRERKQNVKASQSVKVGVSKQSKRPRSQHSQTPFFFWHVPKSRHVSVSPFAVLRALRLARFLFRHIPNQLCRVHGHFELVSQLRARQVGAGDMKRTESALCSCDVTRVTAWLQRWWRTAELSFETWMHKAVGETNARDGVLSGVLIKLWDKPNAEACRVHRGICTVDALAKAHLPADIHELMDKNIATKHVRSRTLQVAFTRKLGDSLQLHRSVCNSSDKFSCSNSIVRSDVQDRLTPPTIVRMFLVLNPVAATPLPWERVLNIGLWVPPCPSEATHANYPNLSGDEKFSSRPTCRTRAGAGRLQAHRRRLLRLQTYALKGIDLARDGGSLKPSRRQSALACIDTQSSHTRANVHDDLRLTGHQRGKLQLPRPSIPKSGSTMVGADMNAGCTVFQHRHTVRDQTRTA